MLKIISLALLFYSYLLIRTNLLTLPRVIPTHFNAAGEANGWGTPDILWFLLGIQILLTGVFLILPYLGEWLPSLVHVGTRRLSDFTPAQRRRAVPLLSDMGAYLAIVTNLFFVFMLHGMIQAARDAHPHLQPGLPMGVLLGGMLGVILYYLKRFNQLAEEKGEEETS